MGPASIISTAALLAATLQLGADNYAVDVPMVRPPDARLVWSDEFDGPLLDRSKWAFDTARNKAGWYNGERQYYAAARADNARADNARIENGRLIIEARRETLSPSRYPDWGGQPYTSARLTTKGKARWTYGFYEIRARLPCTRGTWPAIWMLPDSGGWPDGGEIDIMEQVGSAPNMVHATLHTALFTHAKGTQRGAQRAVPTSCTAFHRYQLNWQPHAITIGIDDHAVMRVADDQPGGRGAWPFDAPFHLILNLAIGGDWAGAKGIDDAALPQRMEIDYVRVWQTPR